MFVRNPFDRLVSLYHYKKLKGFTGIIRGKKKEFKDISFAEFIEDICSIPFQNPKLWHHKISNMYIKPQFLAIPNKGVNFVGRFENLEEDYKKVCDLLGIINPPKLVHKNNCSISRRFFTIISGRIFLHAGVSSLNLKDRSSPAKRAVLKPDSFAGLISFRISLPT